jgi:hypothetical protein
MVAETGRTFVASLQLDAAMTGAAADPTRRRRLSRFG